MKKFHKIAELFPLIDEDSREFRLLVESVKRTGLLEPITLFEDEILDGRNRERVCEKAGVEPKYTQYSGRDPFGFVAAKNLHRRHLTTAQRAFIAREMATMKRGRNAKSTNSSICPKSNVTAGKDMDIGVTSVVVAGRIKKGGIPEVIAAAKAGKINLNSATKISALPKEEQAQALIDILANKKSVKPRAPKKVNGKNPLQEAQEWRNKVHSSLGQGKKGEEIFLTREQIDPDFKGTDMEFASKYGHCSVTTAAERKANEEHMQFGKWLNTVRDKTLERLLRELIEFGNFPHSYALDFVSRGKVAERRMTDIRSRFKLITDAAKSLEPIADSIGIKIP